MRAISVQKEPSHPKLAQIAMFGGSLSFTKKKSPHLTLQGGPLPVINGVLILINGQLWL